MDLLDDYIPQHAYAPLGKRWLGAFIDYVIYLGIYWVMVYSFGEHETNQNGSVYTVTGITAWLVVFGTWFVLKPLIETINDGQTIGKAIVGVRVVRMDGSKAGFDNILARHFFDWLDFLPLLGLIGILVASGNKQTQRIGDLVGKTIVIRAGVR